MKTTINKRQNFEVADVLKTNIVQVASQQNLCNTQRKAFFDITSCRSSKLGGHINTCTSAGINSRHTTRATIATVPNASF